MGPDFYWVIIFALGGIAVGLATCFIGLSKWQEFTSWMALYGFMLAAGTLLGLETPFLTIVVASVLAGVFAATVQVILLPRYRRHNPWYAEELERPTWPVARGLLGFAVFQGTLFGIVTGATAWLLSLL